MPIGLKTVLREWGRIGVIGFGGPPAHVALLRELCVREQRWVDQQEFEDLNAVCGLLPGPASTQLAIALAHKVAGALGAVVGGIAFIVPGLVLLLALATVSLADAPPDAVVGAGLGAGAAVVAVVAKAGVDLLRWSPYLVVGAVVAALAGPWVVLALLGCGLVELGRRMPWRPSPSDAHSAGLAALLWLAFKVGALSYGGGFVIIPLMRADAEANGWMTQTEFLNAVALGQITPGPVVQTVGAVGYAAGGLLYGVLAAVVAFLPSFLIVVLGGGRFERLRSSAKARAFLDGAGPAATGAILGAAVLLLDGVDAAWQWAVLAAAALALLSGRVGTVGVLLAAAVVGAVHGP